MKEYPPLRFTGSTKNDAYVKCAGQELTDVLHMRTTQQRPDSWLQSKHEFSAYNAERNKHFPYASLIISRENDEVSFLCL